MKRHLLLLTLCVLLIPIAKSQDNSVKVLVNTYQKGFIIKGKDSIQYQRAFFNAFPSNFKSFKTIYGWNDATDKPYILNSLHNIAFDHINRLFSLRCIDESIFIKKIIAIAINGESQADGINGFQNDLMEYAPKHSGEFFKMLKMFNSNQIKSLWFFYFDYENSFIRKDEYNKILKLIPPDDKGMISLIAAGYQKATKSWKDSH